MKSVLSPVAVYVAALVLFSMAPISADTARGAGDGPVPQGTALPRNLLDGKTFLAQSGEKGKKASNKDTIEAASIWTRERWYWKMKREYWYEGELKK